MDTTPLLDAFLTNLSLGAWILAAAAIGLLFYGYVVDRVIFESGGRVEPGKLGLVDVLLAAVLSSLIALEVMVAIHAPSGAPNAALPTASDMVSNICANALVLAVLVGGIFGVLRLRDISWREVFGLNRLGPGAVSGYGLLLILLGLPLVQVTSVLSAVILAANGIGDDSAQELVRFLRASDSHMARYIVAVSAVFVAPVLEEFIFRGYLYAVVRRYAGVTVGIVVNATLFAAIHTHLPSFGGLFALAVCLTLAYEWTGSIFVPITMHAIFNAISVAQLLHGDARG